MLMGSTHIELQHILIHLPLQAEKVLIRPQKGAETPPTMTPKKQGGHDHTVTASGTFGGGQAHNNMPPFYTLSYIMKL